MPKVTQNRCYNADGTRTWLAGTAESVVHFLNKYNALRFVQKTVKETAADGTVTRKPVFEPDGTPSMMARPRSGYTQYWNNDGFTNPVAPESLTPQGVGKLMAKLFEVAHMTIRGGEVENATDAAKLKAEEMKTILAGVLAYHEIADKEVAKPTNQGEIENALSVLQKTTNGDTAAASAQIADYLKSKGLPSPAPILQEASVTVVEAVEAAVEAVEAPQDAAPDNAEPVAVETTLTLDEQK